MGWTLIPLVNKTTAKKRKGKKRRCLIVPRKPSKNPKDKYKVRPTHLAFAPTDEQAALESAQLPLLRLWKRYYPQALDFIL